MRTVQTLVNRLGPGDTGCLRGRFREDVTIRAAGTRSRPVGLRPAPGSRARITGRLWVSQQAHDVVIAGLELDGRNATELPSPTINGRRISLIGNRITNRNTAICVLLGSIRGYGKAVDTVVDGNRITRCGRLPAANHHHGVYLENALRTRITNNVIADNADRGIQLYPNAQRTLIARNVIARNGQGIIFSGNHGYASAGTVVEYNAITHARLRSNVEYWYPAGNPVGSRNLVTRNCIFGARGDNITSPPVGFRTRANLIRNPRYVALGRRDVRMRDARCARVVGRAAPLRR